MVCRASENSLLNILLCVIAILNMNFIAGEELDFKICTILSKEGKWYESSEQLDNNKKIMPITID